MTLPFRLLSALLFCAVGSITACSADTDISLAALVDRIEALEEQGKHQHAIISKQNQKIAQQEMKIKELMDWKEQQLNENNNPSTTMEFHQPDAQSDDPSLHDRQQNPKLQSDNPNSNDYLGQEDMIAQSRESGYNDTRGIKRTNIGPKSRRQTEAHRALMGSEGPVAFHAVRNGGDISVGSDHNIVFNHVNINLGGGYHNQHGLFVAPSPGIYIFSTSVYSYGDINLFKNGQLFARAIGGDSINDMYDDGSVTVVAQLVAGDEIWVKHKSATTPTKLYGTYYASFMGCLVVPM